MEEYIDTLKEFYETKSKLKKSKSKKRPVEEIEKIPYSYNKEYLRILENNILEEKTIMLRIKYNILYGLTENESELEKYDEIEEKIKNLRDERDKIKLKIEHKENKQKREIKKINDDINLLMFSYKEVPEDRKEIYKEIQVKREKINGILNNNRTIILKELNKIKIYTVVTDYEPIRGNEIIEQYESKESNESRVEIESENLD
jgi:hypothetical protein